MTVAVSVTEPDAGELLGAVIAAVVSTRATWTVRLSDASVPSAPANRAWMVTAPVLVGVHDTVAVLPRLPPTPCEPTAWPLTVKDTVPVGDPSSLEVTVADSDWGTPTEPFAAVTAMATAARAGTAMPVASSASRVTSKVIARVFRRVRVR